MPVVRVLLSVLFFVALIGSVSADLGDQIERGQALAIIDSIELGTAKAALLEA